MNRRIVQMTKLTLSGQIVASELESDAQEIERVMKAGNPYHDEKGRFSSGGGGSGKGDLTLSAGDAYKLGVEHGSAPNAVPLQTTLSGSKGALSTGDATGMGYQMGLGVNP